MDCFESKKEICTGIGILQAIRWLLLLSVGSVIIYSPGITQQKCGAIDIPKNKILGRTLHGIIISTPAFFCIYSTFRLFEAITAPLAVQVTAVPACGSEAIRISLNALNTLDETR
jgi:hypothetical protein